MCMSPELLCFVLFIFSLRSMVITPDSGGGFLDIFNSQLHRKLTIKLNELYTKSKSKICSFKIDYLAAVCNITD